VGALTLASLVPWVAYCSYRQCAVGNFGLVSFAGTNLVGLTGVILTEEMVPQIRPEHQPLAEHILACRGKQLLFRRYGKSFFPPIPPAGTIWDLDFECCYWQYDEIQWLCAWDYAYYDKYNRDQVRADQALMEFSLDVIRAAPAVYFTVVAHGFFRAVLHIVNRQATLIPLLTFCVLLVMAGIRRRWGRPLPCLEPLQTRRDAALLTLISVPAILLFLGQVCLTVMVAVPDPRYIDPATSLLPSIITVACYVVARRAWCAEA
jgi:hypothetical protein